MNPSDRFTYTLLPYNFGGKKACDCLLTVDGKDYILNLELPNYPSCENCQLHLSWDLKEAIKASNRGLDIAKQNDDSPSLDTLIERIAKILIEHNNINPPDVGLETCNILSSDYSKILNEISAIGWSNLVSVNKDFTEIKLRMMDDREREHLLVFKMTQNTPEFYAEFPGSMNYVWEKNSTLNNLYEVFCKEIESYQDFWAVMEEFDNNCWILEPEKPSRKDTYRKIAVSTNVSLKIDFDPRNPRLFPQIIWLGSENAVFEFREKVMERIETWESDSPIHVNLENLLEIKLPLKDSRQGTGSYDVTCCICYSDRLNGEVPSRTCDNPKCGQSFHIFCLYEWLRSLIQSRKLGNKVFGVCPYCETAISCKPPDS